MLWKCKTAHHPDEVLHLLNGEKRFDLPVPEARVCMTWRGDHPQFWVFARTAGKSSVSEGDLGAWQWRSGGGADEVLDLLSGTGDPGVPAAEAQVAGAWTGTRHIFYCFYRIPTGVEGAAAASDWDVESVTGADSALEFLNGTGAMAPLATARLAAVHRDHRDEFFVFHRRDRRPEAPSTWRRLSVGSAEEVRRAVQPEDRRSADFQVAASPAAPGAFHVFTAPVGVAGRRSANGPAIVG